MPTKILMNVFAGVPPEPKNPPLEFNIEEIETMRDGLRMLRDTLSNWKRGHNQSALAKLAIVSAEFHDRGGAYLIENERLGRDGP